MKCIPRFGQTEFSVTVEDLASEVNAEDAQLGKVMRDIARLPVLSTPSGRNVLQLAYTQPGTTPAERGIASGIAVNGQRARQNHFVVDGATTNWAWTNLSFLTAANSISPNAVEEFRIVTGPSKAEYGRSAGGTVKGGVNLDHFGGAKVDQLVKG